MGGVLHGKDGLHDEGLHQVLFQEVLLFDDSEQLQGLRCGDGNFAAAGHPLLLLLLLLSIEGKKGAVRAGAPVHHVRALHRRVLLDHAAGALRRDHQAAGGRRHQDRLDLRLRRHIVGAIAEAVPAGGHLHERRVPGHRQQPAGGQRQPGLHGPEALLQGHHGPDHAHDSGGGADRVHARVRRLRHPGPDRRGLQDLPGADLRLLPQRGRRGLQLRVGGERAGDHPDGGGVPGAEVRHLPLQVHHQLAASYPEEGSQGCEGLLHARLLLSADRGGAAAPVLHRL